MVYVFNEVGMSVFVFCKLDIFDVIILGGRMVEVFVFISNFDVLKVVVMVYEDFFFILIMVVVGYGKSIWGEQIVRWILIIVVVNIVDYNVGM